MIAANELRIGNIVESRTHNLANAVVEGFTPSGIVFLKNITTYDWLDKLEPITLTSAMLENTFIESEFNAELEFIESLVWLIDCDGGRIGKPINYLHQLQNRYYSLMGEELKINL